MILEASNDEEFLYFHNFTRYMEHLKVKSKGQQIKRCVPVLRDKKTHIVRHKYITVVIKKLKNFSYQCPVSSEGDRSEGIFSKLINVSEVIIFFVKSQCVKKTVHI